MSRVRTNSAAAAEFGVLVGTDGGIDNVSSHIGHSWDVHLHLHCICTASALETRPGVEIGCIRHFRPFLR